MSLTRTRFWNPTRLDRPETVDRHGRDPLRTVGRRGGVIASLLAGLSTPDGLIYIDNLGTGFTDAALRDLLHRITAPEVANV